MAKKSFIVFFDFDKSNITSAAQTTINDAVAAAKAGHSAQVTLTGHTDRSGSEQYNLALSLRRAEAVKANMIRQGIPASSIVVIGKGESQPLVPTADGVREPQNRRVEIVI
jgi:outer membrane protein OmpA-like peptidoglycan-associated protein